MKLFKNSFTAIVLLLGLVFLLNGCAETAEKIHSIRNESEHRLMRQYGLE